MKLQQPDFRILKWESADLSKCVSEKAKIIGSPLEEGVCLYEDLQVVYLTESGKLEDGGIVDSNKKENHY